MRQEAIRPRRKLRPCQDDTPARREGLRSIPLTATWLHDNELQSKPGIPDLCDEPVFPPAFSSAQDIVTAAPAKGGDTCSTPCQDTFLTNQLVWGKMKGYPWWPAQVTPDQAGNIWRGRLCHVVYFGEGKKVQRGWLDPENMRHFAEGYADFRRPKKGTKAGGQTFRIALKLACQHMRMARTSHGITPDRKRSYDSFSNQSDETNDERARKHCATLTNRPGIDSAELARTRHALVRHDAIYCYFPQVSYVHGMCV
eukprot:COSAG01_NODE_233_length_20982_cov_14.774458_14_plen_255_part_00